MKRVAILLENVFDEREFIYPYYRLLDAGYVVDVVGTDKDTEYTGKQGLTAMSTHASADVDAADYDAVVIPGGFSPDYMRRSEDTRKFVREMDRQKKVVAAICHGPWMLASEANIKGRTLTSYPSLQDDLVHAGATYVDKEVVVDDHIITSRTPDDLVPFLRAIIEAVGE